MTNHPLGTRYVLLTLVIAIAPLRVAYVTGHRIVTTTTVVTKRAIVTLAGGTRKLVRRGA